MISFSFFMSLPRMFACAAALWLAVALSAQDAAPPDTVAPINAGTVSVKADAFAPSSAAPASDVVVIDAEKIKAVKARDLSDLLKLVAGVNVNNYGNAGGQQSISIRGSSSAQVIVIVDGQRLYDPQFGATNLALLNADDIEKIEILRGGASAAYGADAIGGVVRISTKKSRKDNLTISAENRAYIPSPYQAFGTNEDKAADLLALISGQHVAAAGSFGIGDSRLSLSGTFDRDMGLFTYDDATDAKRQRLQVPTWGGDAKLTFETPAGGGAFQALLSGQAKRTGAPGPSSNSDPDAFQDDAGARLTLGWKSDAFPSEVFNFDGQLWGQWSRNYYENTNQYGTTKTESTLKSVGANVAQTAFVSDQVSFGYGASAKYEALSDIAGATNARTSGGIFLNSTFQFGQFRVLPAARMDFFSDVSIGLSANLGLELDITKDTTIWIAGGRSYRAPTFNDLYFPTYIDPFYGTYRGNPALRPESSWSGDLGVSIQRQQWSSRTAVFGRYVLDSIINQTTGVGASSVSQPENLSKSFFVGFDEDLSVKIEWFRLGLNYEYNLSFFLGNDKTLTENIRIHNVPEHSLGLQLGMREEHLEFSFSQEFRSLRYYNDFSPTYGNSVSLPAYFVVNAQVTWWFDQESSLWLAADNLLNTRFESVATYPMPGLGLRLGLKLSI